MAADLTPPRRLHLVLRGFVCVGAVVVLPVVAFLLMGLWPGLKFHFEGFGVEILRGEEGGGGRYSMEVAGARIGKAYLYWERLSNPAANRFHRTGLATSRQGDRQLFEWTGKRQVVTFAIPAGR